MTQITSLVKKTDAAAAGLGSAHWTCSWSGAGHHWKLLVLIQPLSCVTSLPVCCDLKHISDEENISYST